MRSHDAANSRTEPAAPALGFAFFGSWYFADGAKEAAPA
jgi:hypothetical protein